MARIRSVHPGQWTDEQFVQCSPLARLLALALRNEADDQGLFEWKPVTLKMRLLPADNVDMEALLSELERHNIVRSYEYDGRKYGAIRNFMDYQRPKKPNAVHFMPPEFRSYVASKTRSSPPVPNQTGNRVAEVGGRRENPIQEEQGLGEGVSVPAREAPPPGDGLDIPDFLDRRKAAARGSA